MEFPAIALLFLHSLPRYVTIAKQVLCKDYRFELYLYHHNRMHLHHHPMLVCCGLEYIFTNIEILASLIPIKWLPIYCFYNFMDTYMSYNFNLGISSILSTRLWESFIIYLLPFYW